MSSSELRMYVALCWQANRKNRNEFEVELRELKKLAGFSTLPTAQKALVGLADKGLVFVMTDYIILQDPYTGEPLHVEDGDPESDPANYYDTTGQNRATRLNLNSRNPEDVEKLLQDCDAEAILQRDGEYKIRCPFHSGDSNPSCSVSPTKRCFYCFGCQATGPLTKLVMKLRGVDKGEAVQFMARSAGKLVEYHEPDKNAEAIYQYSDSNGRLKKQVLRYPGKKFAQRRPAPSGGWIWNTAGMQPLLYNLGRLKYANIVCLCEGEKDCDTLNKLELYDNGGGDVVATTSGNADSWSDMLADELLGKKVIIMPDDDEPGERFRAEVIASLVSRKIDYRMVSFRDAGAKDVSDFIAKGGRKEDLVERIGDDWVSVYAQSHWEKLAAESTSDESIPF
jgi:5S rRNA maturation endonuclease (ribonuclease M5)